MPLLMLFASTTAFGFQSENPGGSDQNASRGQYTVADPSGVETAPPGMVRVPSGRYLPLYVNGASDGAEFVEAFYMDADPVTNEEFLAFVTANPKWRRSTISPLFGEASYLAHWSEDLDLGSALPKQPVTHVSWFAAKAYARWKGNRLPTIAEWEYVAAAGFTHPTGSSEPGYKRRILDLTTRPDGGSPAEVGGSEPNYFGIRDMHGLVWEWVSDFNSALVTGESRADASLERTLFCGSAVIGASDFTDYAAFMRFAFRGSLSASYAGAHLGLRTVRSLK